MSDEYHVNDLLPDFTLELLTEEETAQVAEHLRACPACRAELHAYQLTADELPLALAQVSPRPALKDRLMKEIHARQMNTVRSVRRSFWGSWVAFNRRSALAWSLALIVVLAVGSILLWQRVNQLSGRPVTAMRIVALTNTKDSPKAVGSLMLNPSGEYGALVVDGLPKLDAGHQFQIWLKLGNERISAGVFSVNPDGYASLEISAPLPIIQYQSIGITVEPKGGSPGPTGVKVLGGNIHE